ncbi:hypothetical protein BAUCODRAFT_152822 [Baudoinia panamericana UAMH 10762]|uniref:Uncharacterized protein n=1 Tax=Baudoinia panamericana (strain UAMH 10762) TaxID=717646 RepID=M2MWS2_BAUPA|nr:uncharacterized protein BAUCODRAFT_152822 [Baudoinia panamericana UAMH 10762]EMC91049.1 hypothetical protein BAUCODRAFT_152822 [Baudoinia panamericana UAMH 10762]
MVGKDVVGEDVVETDVVEMDVVEMDVVEEDVVEEDVVGKDAVEKVDNSERYVGANVRCKGPTIPSGELCQYRPSCQDAVIDLQGK